MVKLQSNLTDQLVLPFVLAVGRKLDDCEAESAHTDRYRQRQAIHRQANRADQAGQW